MTNEATPRRRRKWLRCIPPADVLRARLAETETEAAQLRELLTTAERIEAAAMASTQAAVDDSTKAVRP